MHAIDFARYAIFRSETFSVPLLITDSPFFHNPFL